MLVAQLSENGLELGGLFNGIKVHINEYEEIIDKFSKLTLDDKFKDADTGEVYWDKVSEAIGGADERAMSYFKTMDDGNGVINNSSASVQGMSKHLQATGQAFNFAAIKATLLNTALNAGIFLVVSLAIQGVSKAIDNYVHRAEKAIELTDDLKSKHEESKSEYESHKKTVDELASSYEKLAKGVDTASNKNLNLSDDDYKEYLRITNELAETFPTLLKTLDDNGNAILILGENGRTASEDLELLLQAEENLNNFKISQDIDGLFGGVKVKIDEAKKALDEYNASSVVMEEGFRTLKGLSEDSIDLSSPIKLSGDTSTEAGVEYYNALTRAIQNFTNELDSNRAYELSDVLNFDNIVNIDENGAYDFYLNATSLTEEEKKQLQNEIKSQASDVLPLLQDEISSAFTEQSQKKQEADLAWKDFLPSLVATMKSKGSFQELANDEFGEDIQTLAIDIVSNLDSSIAEQMDKNDPYAWVRNNIILPLSQLDEFDRKTISDAYSKLLELNPKDLSETNQDAIDVFIKTIAEKLGKTETEIRLNLGFDVNEDMTKYNNAITKAMNQFGISETHARGLFNELGIDTATEIDNWNRITNGIYDATEAKKRYLSEGNNSDDNVFNPTTFSEQMDELSNMQSLYEKFRENVENNEVKVPLDISDVEELREGWGKIVGTEIFDDFEKIVTSSKSTEAEVQKAFDDMANAYVQSQIKIGGASAETAEIIRSQLKLKGLEANSVDQYVAAKMSEAKAEEYVNEVKDDSSKFTQENVQALIEEANKFGATSQEMADYLYYAMLCGNVVIDGDCSWLDTLAEKLDIDISKLKELLALQGSVETFGTAYQGVPPQYRDALNEQEKKRNQEKYESPLKWDEVIDDVTKAGKEAADAFLEAFEKELGELDTLRSQGKITEKQYLDALRRLYLKYFRDKEKYLKEYAKYEHDYLDGMKSLYESAFSYITSQIDKRIDAINDEKDSVVDSIEAERDARLEVIELQKEQLENEIEGIEKQIEAKEKEIEAIEEANKQRQREMDLMLAEYNLQKMLNQKTVLVK